MKSQRGASYALLELVWAGVIETALSIPLIYEYEEVLWRPGNRREGVTDDELKQFLDALIDSAVLVTPHFSYRPVLEDAADEFVLEAAANGRADIVTFNIRHFKPASRFGVRVFLPVNVLRMCQQEGISYGEK
jgi:predicted nucleic acid-binding protein